MSSRLIMPEEAISFHEALYRYQVIAREERHGRYKRGGYRHYNDGDAMFMEFMAEIFPDEGCDISLGQFPKNDTRITTLSLCLFTSQSATTVITSSQTLSSITETSYTSYARQGLATATWGAQAAGTGGRKTTYSQITFPTVGVTGATLNGFFYGWDSGAGSTGSPTKAVAQANFDDGLASVVATNDVIKVTPVFQYNN